MENKYWVARDLSGALFLTDNKPKRCTYEYGMWISKGENMMQVDGFPNLTWKDEPLEVKLHPVITDLDIKTNETTMEKELKIEVPKGYEIDKEKSTFEKIVFKKVEDPFSKLPKTWEEYCKRAKGYTSYYGDPTDDNTYETKFSKFYNEFSTKERAKQYVALGKLLQLRDYWVGDWKINSDSVYIIYRNLIMATLHTSDFPLAFPTREMAKEFKNCFEDLIKEAHPLV